MSQLEKAALDRLSLPEKVVEHVQVANAAIEKAAAAERARVKQASAISSKIPEVVEALVQGKRIRDNNEERQKIATMLRSPVESLNLLQALASHRNDDERPLGTSVKTASDNGIGRYNSLTDPRTGHRSRQVKESTKALWRGLGLEPPTEEY